MREKGDNNKALQILCNLEGKKFERYCESFAPDRALFEEAQRYNVVNSKFVAEFLKNINRKEKVDECEVAGLEIKDLGASIALINALFRWVSFNDAISFGLPRKTVARHA